MRSLAACPACDMSHLSRRISRRLGISGILSLLHGIVHRWLVHGKWIKGAGAQISGLLNGLVTHHTADKVTNFRLLLMLTLCVHLTCKRSSGVAMMTDRRYLTDGRHLRLVAHVLLATRIDIDLGLLLVAIKLLRVFGELLLVVLVIDS